MPKMAVNKFHGKHGVKDLSLTGYRKIKAAKKLFLKVLVEIGYVCCWVFKTFSVQAEVNFGPKR